MPGSSPDGVGSRARARHLGGGHLAQESGQGRNDRLPHDVPGLAVEVESGHVYTLASRVPQAR